MALSLSRRAALKLGAGLALGGCALRESTLRGADKPADKGPPTKFLIACMTLPYSQFPLARALSGLKAAGYKYIAWGTSHKEEGGMNKAVLAGDASLDTAKELGNRCRDMGLEPLMMFGPSPENVEALKTRVKQAAAAGIGQVLTFGHTKGNDASQWIKNFKELGPVARDLGVRIVVKQHGGNTGTGAGCAEITRAVNDDGVRVNYDAGNVMDYNKLDPLPDIKKCADQIYSFCIKDHRRVPKDEDCGPGLGEIDHYQLLNTVAFTGRTIPLCCENIFAPLLKRPTAPEGVDAMAKRAREFLELVVQGLQA
jgi:sugar phosphate isomerase/epimerase